MKKTGVFRVLRKASLASAIVMGLMAGEAIAQSATGELYGQVSGGNAASVVIQNIDNGFTRTIAVGGDGKFRLGALAPGNYEVKLEDAAGQVLASRKTRVTVGSGAEVDFADLDKASTLETVTVRGSAMSRIDTTSVESTSVYTADQLERLPVARDVISVAALTPGVNRGSGGFSALPVVAGASAQENGYYVNGFDVTDLYKMSSYSMVPFDAIAEQQVKTGGYPAEFGRSLGGVLNVVTKSGSNDFHYGISTFMEPDATRSTTRNTHAYDGSWYAHPSNDSTDSYEGDLWASGPIIKDKLFFYVLGKFKYYNSDGYGRTSSTNTFSNTPQGIFKLDWNINDANLLSFTGWRDYNVNHYTYYTSPSDFSATRSSRKGSGWSASGGNIGILNWTSYLTDALTMKATLGRAKYSRESYDSNGSCPYAYDSRSGTTVAIGCWTSGTQAASGNGDERKAARLDFDWQLSDKHDLKFGLDDEKFTSVNVTQYSGGVYYRYYTTSAGASLGSGITVPDDTTEVVRVRTFRNGGSFITYNTAAYLSDDWQFTDKLHLYLGLRNEGFDNRNGANKTFIKSDNLWSPRLGFAYDLQGDSSVKLFGTLGRYYIPIPSNTNIRLAGNEYDVTQWYTFSSVDSATGTPTLDTLLGTIVSSDGSVPDTRQVTAANLKPMYQDELILGFQQAIWNGWNWGVKGTARRVGNGMDDYCYSGLVQAWGEAKYGSGFDASAFDNCVLINPGEDTAWYANIDGTLTKITIPASVFGVDKYRRTYYGADFTLERPWDGTWSLNASYTWGHSYGNAEGYSLTTIGQDDAGISEAFDYPSLMNGASGNLNNDRRHAFKMFGTYQLTDKIRLKGAATAMSGTPKLCLGYVPDGLEDSSSAQGYGSVSYYCNGVVHPRGSMGTTPWTYNIDAGAEYERKLASGTLSLGLDVFNLFNFQRPIYYYYYHEETVDTLDLNYGTAVTYQSPRYLRFTARWTF
jgi:hypothetical protein